MRSPGAVILSSPTKGTGGLCPHLGLSGPGLLPLANEPVVVHQLRTLASAGVRNVVLLSGRRTAFEASLAARSVAGVRIHPIDIATGEIGGLRAAAEAFDAGDGLLVQRGDVMLSAPLAPHLDGAGGSGRVDVYDVAGHAAAFVLPGDFLQDPGLADDETLRNGLQRMRGHECRRHAIPGSTLDGCDREAALAAQRFVLDSIERSVRSTSVVASEIQGRVIVERGAQITRSVIRGPAVIGPGAVIDHAFIGPYTSIGARTTVEAAEVEHSIVLSDVRIRFLDARLASSVIGREARVERRISTPRSLEMVLARGDEVRIGS